MKECPVCKTPYKQEVNICKRCNLSEENIIYIDEISPDNPILSICIPTLVKSLNKYQKNYQEINHKNQLLLNIQNLDRKLQTIETEQKQGQQEIKTLKKIVEELQSKIQSKDEDYSQDLDIQESLKSSTQVQPLELTEHDTLTNLK